MWQIKVPWVEYNIISGQVTNHVLLHIYKKIEQPRTMSRYLDMLMIAEFVAG